VDPAQRPKVALFNCAAVIQELKMDVMKGTRPLQALKGKKGKVAKDPLCLHLVLFVCLMISLHRFYPLKDKARDQAEK
jgi:hypothetical protein